MITINTKSDNQFNKNDKKMKRKTKKFIYVNIQVKNKLV